MTRPITTSTATAALRRAALGGQHALAGLLLAGGCLNGFLVRAVEAWSLHGAEAFLLGISPFELITLAIAVMLACKPGGGVEPARIGIAEGLGIAALLLPSSTVSWAAVLLYAAWRASRSQGDHRAGALLFAGLAATSLWSSIIIKWMALALTTAEASLVAWLLAFLRGDLVHAGNVIGVPDGHTLIVMTACSTLHGLPRAVLALAAISLVCGVSAPARLARGICVLAAAYFAANLVRLGIMAWSQPLFEIAHGPVGANVFDGLQTLLIFVLALRGGRQ